MEFYCPSWNSQERGGSKQLHWLGSWKFFWLHKTAAGAAVPGQVVTGGTLGRDPQEGGRKNHPGVGGWVGNGFGASLPRGGSVRWFLRATGRLENRSGLGFPTAGMWEGPSGHFD